MEAFSEVILRNRHRLETGPVLLVDPEPDGLAASLLQDGVEPRVSSQDHGAFSALAEQGVAARFEPAPQADGTERTVILRLPREKDRFDMVLHALAAGMNPLAKLWVVGEKRSGVNSAPRRLARHFAAVAKLDSARHCSLFEATVPRASRPFTLDGYVTTWPLERGGASLEICTLPGVFAHGRLDPGTRLLLDVLDALPVDGRVLDFACGTGVVGLALLARKPGMSLTLLDSSALALEAARRSLERNGLRARLLPSDGLRGADGRYDWIVTNPPFHRGVSQRTGIAADFFQRAGTFLERNGSIVVVFNRHLPYENWARAQFGHIDRLAQGRDYMVIKASRTV